MLWILGAKDEFSLFFYFARQLAVKAAQTHRGGGRRRQSTQTGRSKLTARQRWASRRSMGSFKLDQPAPPLNRLLVVDFFLSNFSFSNQKLTKNKRPHKLFPCCFLTLLFLAFGLSFFSHSILSISPSPNRYSINIHTHTHTQVLLLSLERLPTAITSWDLGHTSKGGIK